MPKATAVWLIENTTLSFRQIAQFCGLHILEVQAIADGESAINMIGLDPMNGGQLTADEIARCEASETENLKITTPVTPDSLLGKKRSKYTPVSKRQDRPDGIAWVLKYYPDLSDNQISRLLGTTSATIKAVREKTHWNSPHIKPRSPVQIGLCSQGELDKLIEQIRDTIEKNNS